MRNEDLRFGRMTSATLNGVTFSGTVIADASITVGDGSNVIGRVLAGTGPTGAVTMAGDGGNTIGGCSAADDFLPVTAIPTLGEGAMVALVVLLVGGGLFVLRRRRVQV